MPEAGEEKARTCRGLWASPTPSWPGPAALPSARPASRCRFPRALREAPGEKNTRQGLNCNLLPTPWQFRSRGAGSERSDLSTGFVSAGGMWVIITPTQLTLPRLPQSRAAPSRCSGRGFPAEHREQRAQPTPPGARCCSVKMDLRFDLLVQNPRAMARERP